MQWVSSTEGLQCWRCCVQAQPESPTSWQSITGERQLVSGKKSECPLTFPSLPREWPCICSRAASSASDLTPPLCSVPSEGRENPVENPASGCKFLAKLRVHIGCCVIPRVTTARCALRMPRGSCAAAQNILEGVCAFQNKMGSVPLFFLCLAPFPCRGTQVLHFQVFETSQKTCPMLRKEMESLGFCSLL